MHYQNCYNLVAIGGWCCSAGCRYVSIMHGLSSRFFESGLVSSLTALLNPSSLRPLTLSAPEKAARH